MELIDKLILFLQVPEAFEKSVLDFHEKAGLVFGAYDFSELEDDVIFLSCNPVGNWLWLEERLGLNVSEHVARYLLGRDEENSSRASTKSENERE